MDPNYYSYSQTSGAAQAAGYQNASPAAGVWDGAFRHFCKDNDPEASLGRLVAQTTWDPQVILRIVDLRAMQDPDPGSNKHFLPFDKIYRIISQDFPDLNIDQQTLERRWAYPIRSALRGDFRTLGRLDERARAALGLGAETEDEPGSVDPRADHPGAPQQRPPTFQEVHRLSFRAPQPGGGASFGGSHTGHAGSHWGPQPGYGNQYANYQAGPSDPYGVSQRSHRHQYGNAHAGPSGSFGGSHVGHGGQHGAHPPSFTGEYQNTPGANQYPVPAASYDPQLQLPPIATSAQVPGNPVLPAVEPAYQMSDQNYNNAAWQDAAPGTQEPMAWDGTGGNGSSSQAPHGDGLREHERFDLNYQFPGEENNWLLREGIYLGHGNFGPREFYDSFVRVFSDHRVPSKDRVMKQFHGLRRLRD